MRITLRTRHRRLLIATGDDTQTDSDGYAIALGAADLTIAPEQGDDSGYEDDESHFGFAG